MIDRDLERTEDLEIDRLPDIASVPQDLVTPQMTEGEPAPGRRVRQVAAACRGTEVYHALYLPTDWQVGAQYPVIVEYAGNGLYQNAFGDVCCGRVEDCNLGYGIGGGQGFVWVCLPFISEDRTHNQRQWWGDVSASVDYCRMVVSRACVDWGGDASALFLAGFSRGAIACNFIGLHDDAIARLWRGFIAHSHYDGVRAWSYAGSDRYAAARRLARLRGRAQFISHEGSVAETRRYLEEVDPDGAFTFQAIPYRNHTDTWVLRDISEREVLREWVRHTIDVRPGL